MIHAIDADKHNFGQSVELTERDQRTWYRKPRTVFWESLFFGVSSPLAPHFSRIGENGKRPLAAALFNIETIIESPWLGYSGEVKRADNFALTPEHFYSFGGLLAYSFLFGIRDLHKHNLVVTGSHVQAIDAEVVLTDLILPNESVLLPFKDIDFDLCGARTLKESFDKFSDTDRQSIFSGYVDLFAAAFMRRTELFATFEALNLTAPIRVIVRNTRNYKLHMEQKFFLEDLLPEESLQLARGDVPYFFKRSDDDRLYYLKDENGGEGIVQDLGRFKPDITRHARPPKFLIGSPDVIERKMVQGFFLIQKQFNDFGSYEFGWNGRKLIFGPDYAKNEFTGHTFSKK